jgi:hypothetical protein
MKIKKFALASMVFVVIALLTACKSIDVVGEGSIISFKSVIDKLGDKVTNDSENNRWTLQLPTGEKFSWSKDFSSNKPDASVEFDATPFINAGLDVTKLPSDKYVYNKETGKITMPYEFKQDKFEYNGEPTPIDSFEKIVQINRKIIGYHQDLEHYGIKLGNGNMFEWAKDINKNDKDIVFVLNPQPFIDAGVAPDKVKGWIFAKVKVMDENRKEVQVDKFLKPFDLK